MERERPDHVKVVRKDHVGINGKGVALLHTADRLEEQIYRARIIEQRLASMRDSREEVTSTSHFRFAQSDLLTTDFDRKQAQIRAI